MGCVRGPSGKLYEIETSKTHGNCYELDDKGRRVASLCIYAPGVPKGDSLLAQKLVRVTGIQRRRSFPNTKDDAMTEIPTTTESTTSTPPVPVEPADGGPAFPTESYDQSAATQGIGVTITDHPGMTLRDFFAAHALAWIAPTFGRLPETRARLAQDCYDVADAMLAARKAARTKGAER